MVPLDVCTEIVIGRPLAEVAGYVSDPNNAPTWQVDIKAVECTARPPRAGSRIAFVSSVLGRRVTTTYEVVEHVADTRLVLCTADGAFPLETTYAWESVGARVTRMTLSQRGEPRGLSAVLAPLAASTMRRASRRDLARLKAVLEARARVATGAPTPVRLAR